MAFTDVLSSLYETREWHEFDDTSYGLAVENLESY